MNFSPENFTDGLQDESISSKIPTILPSPMPSLHTRYLVSGMPQVGDRNQEESQDPTLDEQETINDSKFKTREIKPKKGDQQRY